MLTLNIESLCVCFRMNLNLTCLKHHIVKFDIKFVSEIVSSKNQYCEVCYRFHCRRFWQKWLATWKLEALQQNSLWGIYRVNKKTFRQESWWFGDDFLVCQGMNIHEYFKYRRGRLWYAWNDPPQQISLLVLDFCFVMISLFLIHVSWDVQLVGASLLSFTSIHVMTPMIKYSAE